jgi:hypothetical protein
VQAATPLERQMQPRRAGIGLGAQVTGYAALQLRLAVQALGYYR